MTEVFDKQFEVGWRDVDLNGHVANMTYLQYAVDARIAYFAQCGFAPEAFLKHRIGPVIKSDHLEYFREMMILEKFRVTVENGGFSEDVSRFRVVNNIYKADGTHAARVTSIGGWLDLDKRKLAPPPDLLKAAWIASPHTEDFEVLESSLKVSDR